MGDGDNVIHTKSVGAAAEGVRDQYADGKAAKVIDIYLHMHLII